VFALGAVPDLKCLVKGQIDGIGTRPRLRAQAADKRPLIDQAYAPDQIIDLPAAIHAAGAWLLETQKVELVAVGYRVVHGGPDLRNWSAMCRWRRCISQTTWRRSGALRARRPDLPQFTCFDTAFRRGDDAVADHYAIPGSGSVELWPRI
jgi:acetate kinase